VARGKRKSGRLQVFKGREAKLNYAIFQILALKGPQTIYDIHKTVKTRRRLRHVRYASVNKRVRALKESGYINKTGAKKTKAGFEASIYELTARAYLALLLSRINLDHFIKEAEDNVVLSALAALSSAAKLHKCNYVKFSSETISSGGRSTKSMSSHDYRFTFQ